VHDPFLAKNFHHRLSHRIKILALSSASLPLSAFRIRSFRFQWPADLLTTWAFEMETLILGWYVLVETGSVVLLTLFGALQFIGTLIAPFLGVIGDRWGRRKMLYLMRGCFAALAVGIMILGMTDRLAPTYVLFFAFGNGLLRPSDMVMRNALIADTIPGDTLANALGLARMSMDSAKIFGALAGAGLFAALGLGNAYAFVAATYLTSLVLTLGVANVIPAAQTAPDAAPLTPNYWRELKQGLAYIWNTPPVLAIMWLAFLLNLTAFPISHGLLPYAAREVFLVDETGLSHLVAAFATGALTGSLTVAWIGRQQHAARLMMINIVGWYVMLAVFAQFNTMFGGMAALFVMGVVHSLAMVSMAVALLGIADSDMRGRVMGVRMLCVYGVPIGLLVSGVLIEAYGFAATVSMYVSVGIVVTLLIGVRWRRAVWQ
jgi:MFS family permease